jgi:two-component system, sporulation sensor kinase E
MVLKESKCPEDTICEYKQKLEQINKQLEKERKLRLQAEQQLEMFFNASSDLLAIFSPNGIIKRANSNFIACTGYTGQETVEDIIKNRVHPDDLHTALNALRQVLNGQNKYVDFRVCTNNDSSTWMSWNVVAADNNMMLAVGRDISALKESEQRLADIINFLPDATFVIDKDGVVIAWNRAIEEMTGLKAAQMLGRGNYEYSIPFYGHRCPILVDIIRLSEDELDPTYWELERDDYHTSAMTFCPNIGAYGATLYGTASPLYDSSGKLVGAIESLRDISERTRNEMILRQSQEKFSKAFHGSPIMMIMATFDGIIIDINESFCTCIGYTRQEIIDRNSNELLFYRDPEMPHRIETILKENSRIDNQPFEFWDKSGQLHQGRLWSQLLDLDGVLSHIACVIDVTDQIRMENEMGRLDRLRLVGEMAASIGHEIRNPMTTIRGFLQLLVDKKAYAEDKDFFELMIEELDRANEIISEYLGMARDKLVDLKPRYLDQVVKSIYPMILADANFREMAVNLDLAKPPVLLIDEKEIRQMIINLARNGLEAMSSGGTLTIGTKIAADEIVLYIQDEGHGLDPIIQDKIGSPFQTTKDKGTGLGLPVCYSIAARHHATIDFKTGPAGTSFFVRFPYPQQSNMP